MPPQRAGAGAGQEGVESVVSRCAAPCWTTPSWLKPATLHARRAGAAALLAACASGAALASPAPPRVDDAQACDQSGAAVEASLRLPPGLLRAIGRVESGRRDPVTGAYAAWPWTINANGQGRFFTDAASAAAAVRGLQTAGTASVDIGCYQVNLMHHPLAFQRLEDGFDPAINAAYAGAFLQSLRQRHGSWEVAVAAYHSASAERGEAYRLRVYAAWNPGTPVALPPPRPLGPVVIRIAGPDLSGPESVIRVWTPSRPGAAPARIAMPAPAAVPMVVAAMPAQPIDELPPHGGGILPNGISTAGLPSAAMLPAALVAPGRDPALPTP